MVRRGGKTLDVAHPPLRHCVCAEGSSTHDDRNTPGLGVRTARTGDRLAPAALGAGGALVPGQHCTDADDREEGRQEPGSLVAVDLHEVQDVVATEPGDRRGGEEPDQPDDERTGTTLAHRLHAEDHEADDDRQHHQSGADDEGEAPQQAEEVLHLLHRRNAPAGGLLEGSHGVDGDGHRDENDREGAKHPADHGPDSTRASGLVHVAHTPLRCNLNRHVLAPTYQTIGCGRDYLTVP